MLVVLATALTLAPSLVFAQSAASATSPAAPASVDSAMRVAQWTEDLRVLVAELERRHPDLYHVRSKPEFAGAAAGWRATIPTQDNGALTLGLMQLIASLGDSHTSLSTSYQALGFHRLPFSPYLFDDGVFIRDADTSVVHLIGARIVAVNGVLIDSVLARLRRFAAYENDSQLKYALPLQFVVAEILSAVGVSTRNDSTRLTLVGRDGIAREQMISTMRVGVPVVWGLSTLVSEDAAPLFRRNTNRNYWFEHLERDSTIYVAYNRAANDSNEPLDAFAERVVQLARSRNVTRVIVDFRRNQGGNSSVFAALQRRLVALRDERPRVQLIGIIGRQTFSSGLWNALAFQRTVGATMYGEPTGGKPNHFGEVRQFSLPHSKIVVNHSTRRWRLLRDEDPPSLAPDVAVPNRSAEYFALRDVVLERILSTTKP